MKKTENNMETEYRPFRAQTMGDGNEGRLFLTPVRAKEAKFMGLSLVPYFVHQNQGNKGATPVGDSLDPPLHCSGFYI